MFEVLLPFCGDLPFQVTRRHDHVHLGRTPGQHGAFGLFCGCAGEELVGDQHIAVPGVAFVDDAVPDANSSRRVALLRGELAYVGARQEVLVEGLQRE